MINLKIAMLGFSRMLFTWKVSAGSSEKLKVLALAF